MESNFCTALAITATVVLGSNLSFAQEIEPTKTVCGCDDANCSLKKIWPKKILTHGACSDCNCEVCLLETKSITEKKTCFKVEEKVICVPAVRMPWHKCNPPTTSKTKTITVLEKRKLRKRQLVLINGPLPKPTNPSSTAANTATDIETTAASKQDCQSQCLQSSGLPTPKLLVAKRNRFHNTNQVKRNSVP